MSNRAPADNRKEQIYATAQLLFSRHGYHATTMRDIAGALNLQGGSLYAHISAKEDLLWEIVNRAADEFHAAVAPVAAPPDPAADRLRAMIHAHIGVVARNLENATVFFDEWRFLNPERRTAIAARRDAYEGYFRQVI
jgi:AcrR family transcriptional regulator